MNNFESPRPGPVSGPPKPLAAIVAISRNRCIGKGGQLPWHISEDLKHFKHTTLGHAIIMGRKTFDSIGKPLPGRRNIVVSRNRKLAIKGCEVYPSVKEAIDAARRTTDRGAGDQAADPCPFIVGGEGIYQTALPLITRIYLTQVDRVVNGDAFFPHLDEEAWEVAEARFGTTEGVSFFVLERRR